MGLALRMLLVDPSDRIYRFAFAKFDEMRRGADIPRSQDNGYKRNGPRS
jgi:hypothetical protein